MKISVVVPSYNQAQYLPDSIDSALNQTLIPHEIVVVDDGSTDNTREVVSRFPVTYMFQQNAGPSAARNRAIEHASGDWIAFLDADDIWLPRKLELQSAAIADHGLCYCGTTRFFPDGHTEEAEWVESEDANFVLRHHNFLDPSAVVVRRDLVRSVGGFNTKMRAAEDWELWLKLSRICAFVAVPERLLMYRITQTSASSNPEIHLDSMEDIIAAATADLPAGCRWIQAKRMRSVRNAMVAIKYRHKGDHRNALRYAIRGLAHWPSPFYDQAFKIMLLELWRNLNVR